MPELFCAVVRVPKKYKPHMVLRALVRVLRTNVSWGHEPWLSAHMVREETNHGFEVTLHKKSQHLLSVSFLLNLGDNYAVVCYLYNGCFSVPWFVTPRNTNHTWFFVPWFVSSVLMAREETNHGFKLTLHKKSQHLLSVSSLLNLVGNYAVLCYLYNGCFSIIS